jgi:hypothetical protein
MLQYQLLLLIKDVPVGELMVPKPDMVCEGNLTVREFRIGKE